MPSTIIKLNKIKDDIKGNLNIINNDCKNDIDYIFKSKPSILAILGHDNVISPITGELNQSNVNLSKDDYKLFIIQKIKDYQIDRVRKDSVLICQIKISVSECNFFEDNNIDIYSFFIECYYLLKEDININFVISCFIHYGSNEVPTPYISFKFIPILFDGIKNRLNAKEMFNSKKMTSLHRKFYNKIGYRYKLKRDDFVDKTQHDDNITELIFQLYAFNIRQNILRKNFNKSFNRILLEYGYIGNIDINGEKCFVYDKEYVGQTNVDSNTKLRFFNYFCILDNLRRVKIFNIDDLKNIEIENIYIINLNSDKKFYFNDILNLRNDFRKK